MALVVDLQHVTKIYRLGSERSNWRALIPGRLGEQRFGEPFDALNDVSLQIEAGESVGLIGANGAGKSTILKILAGVVEPTYGSVDVYGTVAPIIELGVGFDPELNGSENLRFGGALLGHSPEEVDERYDAIVDFAGLADFMDTPVKRYSTGMRARTRVSRSSPRSMPISSSSMRCSRSATGTSSAAACAVSASSTNGAQPW